MKIGKVSQSIVSRFILKPFRTQKEMGILSPSPSEPCRMVRAEGKDVITATASRYGRKETIGIYAMAEAMGHLAVKGVKTDGIYLSFFLPQWLEEQTLKAITTRMANIAAKYEVSLLGAKAEVLPCIDDVLVQVEVWGRGHTERLVRGEPFFKADLVCAGYAGLEGTFRILEEREEELGQRFVKAFLEPVREKQEELFTERVREIICKGNVKKAHQAGDGGIFAALWDMTAGIGHGMQIDLKKIPLRQETVEICEYFGLNPYQLASAGCLLLAADDGEKLVKDLKECGLEAAVLGTLDDTNNKLIQNGEETRCLDRPAVDELVKIYRK